MTENTQPTSPTQIILPRKVKELVTLDKSLWEEFKLIRIPYGTVNELFEDCIRILLAKQPEHPALLEKFRNSVAELSNKEEV